MGIDLDQYGLPISIVVLSNCILSEGSSLIDICGVDHPFSKRRFEVVHNFIEHSSGPFPSAGRWEREVWDMFGVSSINHRIYAVYQRIMKRVVSEPIEMTQEFRYFDSASPWEERSDV
ncbi:hypothetical protein MKW92_008372 [Papaver armeniacum]|nr:hypothetical protein MKW92_008372 [Papaver armeniacum]